MTTVLSWPPIVSTYFSLVMHAIEYINIPLLHTHNLSSIYFDRGRACFFSISDVFLSERRLTHITKPPPYNVRATSVIRNFESAQHNPPGLCKLPSHALLPRIFRKSRGLFPAAGAVGCGRSGRPDPYTAFRVLPRPSRPGNPHSPPAGGRQGRGLLRVLRSQSAPRPPRTLTPGRRPHVSVPAPHGDPHSRVLASSTVSAALRDAGGRGLDQEAAPHSVLLPCLSATYRSLL